MQPQQRVRRMRKPVSPAKTAHERARRERQEAVRHAAITRGQLAQASATA